MVALSASRPALVAGLRLVRLVGSGGEGEVWEARDQRGRRRALKLVRPAALAEDADRRGRQLLAIDHPALVRVYRTGVLTGEPLAGWGFVEMDYIDGPSLSAAEPEAAIVARLQPLAEALDLLHGGAWSAGVPLVHRDVKPANIVARSDGSLVLVDPSTLRALDATELTRVGTPVFTAPEVPSGRFGPAADVYSFAVTVVALVSGARGRNLEGLLQRVPHLDLPPGVALALSHDPGERPVSCRRVLAAGSTLVLAPPLSPVPSNRTVYDRDADWRPSSAPDSSQGSYRGDDSDGYAAAPSPLWDGFGDFEEVGEAPRAPRPAAADEADEWDATSARHGDGAPQWQHPTADDWSEPVAAGAAASPPASTLWLWTAALIALVSWPVLAWSQRWSTRAELFDLLPLLAAAHLLAMLLARRLLLGVVAPPLAWALLLADRAGGGERRRAWAGAVFTGATGAVTAALIWGYEAAGVVPRRNIATVVLAALVVVVVAVRATGGRGIAGLALRLAVLPLWAAGALVLGVGGLLLAPLAGTSRPALRTLASLWETLRPPPASEVR